MLLLCHLDLHSQVSGREEKIQRLEKDNAALRERSKKAEDDLSLLDKVVCGVVCSSSS